MTDLDLDRLGDLWRQEPAPDELAELRRSAEAARRRARWGQLADAIAAAGVSAVVALLVLRNPAPETLIIGGGAILILLLSHMRQRKMRAAALRSLTGTSEQLLDQSIERVRASQKRVRFGAVTLGPAILLGLLVAHTAGGGSRGSPGTLVTIPELRTVVLAGTIFILAAAMTHFWRSHQKCSRELERLKSLRDAYLSEGDRNREE